MALPNTSTYTVDAEANQRIRATTTRTTARGSTMTEEIKWLASMLAGWMMCLAWQGIKKIIEKTYEHSKD